MARTKQATKATTAREKRSLVDEPPKQEETAKKHKNANVTNSPLSALLQGMSMETFDSEYFEKKPLHIKDIYPCSGLFSRSSLLNIIANESLRHNDDLTVTVYKDGVRQNFEPPEDDDHDGVATSEQVDKLMTSGYSVQFYQPQRYQKNICNINAALEAHYGCLAGASAYLTPPHAQALAPHHDDVDVFILQTEGSKHWKLYEPLVELAGEHSNDLDPSMLKDPIMELTLEEGDMLYFPRGVVHQASTSGSFSTHVTISIYHHNSWANFMEVALPQVLRRAFEKDVEFRKGLPPNYLGFMGSQFKPSTANAAAFTKHFHELATKMIEHVNETDLHAAADVAALDFVKHRLPPAHSAIRKCHLKDTLSLHLRHKRFCRIVLQDDTVTLFHAVNNCRKHHMGRCTCDENEEDDESDDDDADLPPIANGITFPLECAPVLLHLYSAGETSIANMLERHVADEDSIRAVIFRLIAEDMVERSK
ncbi:hypothetical protein H310_10379 [Aphanomyces invadans]|uniref:Bifunctional lysine-specific demethylase and histidyl-hydroxylase n=1 Tax=Aphanomyces invadans TaxID=157072 RepID=A0A024TPW4_9STRA|nr:hypothetical protein H310_10379 [Aphanomyces invadans]ETV96185.1 hypothetical protein H310_10379 [Aphanomyces invadans]|eukprot:XP_008874977.1 hypothetical protein H310_10379 [Aphanomyces invadans]